MGFRFRKSIKIAPGVRLNLSKRGVSSVSVGGKGLTYNINKKGSRTTIGLPGTGMSHSSYQSHKDASGPNPVLIGIALVILAVVLIAIFN